MTGPYLAGSDKPTFHKDAFTGKSSAIVTPVRGYPGIRSNPAGGTLEKMKLSPKARKHALHTK